MLDIRPAYGQRGISVRMLQEHLQEAGYFDHAVTGYFGDTTRRNFGAFLADMKLTEPPDNVTELSAMYLAAAIDILADKTPVVFVDRGSGKAAVAKAQRLLRSMGYYRGRTDGKYAGALFNAILAYQKDRSLVTSAESPGAGRIGPLTSAHIKKDWMRKRVSLRVDQWVVMEKIRDILAQRGLKTDGTLQKGATGDIVQILQQTLAERGFFPAHDINGSFGPLTEKSVLAYQPDRGIVKSADDTGAGMAGPVTMGTLREEKVRELYRLVRGHGWEAL